MALARLLAFRPATMSLPQDRSQEQRAEFDRLFNEYSAPIYNYVLRMTGDADRAADIAQDTFIKAYRKLDTLAEATSARAWLYRIATNTAFDEMRRRRNTVRMPEITHLGTEHGDHDRMTPELSLMGPDLRR